MVVNPAGKTDPHGKTCQYGRLDGKDGHINIPHHLQKDEVAPRFGQYFGLLTKISPGLIFRRLGPIQKIPLCVSIPAWKVGYRACDGHIPAICRRVSGS